MELQQCTGPPAGGRGFVLRRRSLPKERNSCNEMPHCMGAVGSANPTVQWHTAQGRWVVELLQCIASLPGAVGSGTHAVRGPTNWGDGESYPGASRCLKSETLAMHCLTAWGSGQCNSCHTLPHCLGAVGSASAAMHCLTAWGHWAAELLQCAGLPAGGTGSPTQKRSVPKERYSCNALPHYPEAVGSATPAMHCLAA